MPRKHKRTSHKKTSSSRSKQSNQLASQASRWGAIIGMVFVVLLFSALLYMAQRAVQEPQDVRRDAMIADGEVQLSTQLSPAQLQVDQPATLTYSINTNGQPINGTEIIFDIITDTFEPEDLEITGLNTELTYVYQEVDAVEHGMKVKVIALTTNLEQGFSTTTAAPYLELKFTPRSTGEVSLNFDVERSIAPAFSSNPIVDQLRTIAITQYTVEAAADSTDNDDADNDEASETTVEDDLRFSESELETDLRIFTNDSNRSPLNFSQLQADETYFFTAVARIANNTYDSSTTSNQQLAVRMRANDQEVTNSFPYQNLLRADDEIAVAFESTFVAQEENNFNFTIDPDNQITESSTDNNSISFTYHLAGTGGATLAACNERCEANRDCPVNHRCFDTGTDGERCRLATNVTSTQCQAGSQTATQQASEQTTAAPVQGCNQSCGSNNDCDVNLRCYQGACRLATNPSSMSCTAATAGIVSQDYQKGAQLHADNPASAPTPTATPQATPQVTPTPTPLTVFPEVEPESNAWEELLAYFQNGFSADNLPAFLSMPVLIGALAIILFLIILLIIARTSARARANYTKTKATTDTAGATTTGNSTDSSSSATSPTNTTKTETNPSPSATSMTQPKENPTPPALPGHGITTPNKSDANTMLDRLKEKGVKKPGE
ncbi:MAG: hypothetical protein WDZ94_04760 [Patescibacteria group bacterium]